MAIIHNGFINRKYHDSFKDTGLNNVDVATVKFYKKPKPMWKQLGFVPEDENINVPPKWLICVSGGTA